MFQTNLSLMLSKLKILPPLAPSQKDRLFLIKCPECLLYRTDVSYNCKILPILCALHG